MCIVTLFIIAKKWKPKCPSLLNNKTKGGISYNGILFSMKRNEILIPATVKMNLENALLSDKSHTQKGIYYTISFV